MGSLKAITDNQHVKYVICTRYAQNGIEKKTQKLEKKKRNRSQQEKKKQTRRNVKRYLFPIFFAFPNFFSAFPEVDLLFFLYPIYAYKL